MCRCKSCFSRSGERHITTRAISCARAEHRVSIEHQRTLPKHASEREQRRVSMQKLTQLQRRASHPHEGDQHTSSLSCLQVARSALALRRRPCRWHNNACSCSVLREAVCASLTWICDVEQLYTDAALMLDASPRVAAAEGSGLIDLHLHCIYNHMQTGLGRRLHQPCCSCPCVHHVDLTH